MKKYHLANYINNKTATIHQREPSVFPQWHVIYYDHGKMVDDSAFQSEQDALLNGISYIEKDTEKE